MLRLAGTTVLLWTLLIMVVRQRWTGVIRTNLYTLADAIVCNSPAGGARSFFCSARVRSQLGSCGSQGRPF